MHPILDNRRLLALYLLAWLLIAVLLSLGLPATRHSQSQPRSFCPSA